MSKDSSSDVSPGAPDSFNNNLKSRTTPPGSGNRRIPLSNGRTPPSKWDDADRWIKSPVSGKPPGPGGPRRQIKSKSGPLGGPGVMNLSPSTPKFERRSFVEGSPRGPGALVPRELFTNNGTVRKFGSLDKDPNSMPDSLDVKFDNASKEDKLAPSKAGECTNQLTQTGYKVIGHLPSKEKLSLDNNISTKDEVWDIQVDKGITSSPKLPKVQEPIETIKKDNASSLEASKNISKCQSEEEMITAWENLQKAKAEEAIRKLEMKLEKKRLTSTEKIMKKLKASQRKAEAMRSMVVSKKDCSKEARILLRGWTFRCLHAKACSTCNCFISRGKV